MRVLVRFRLTLHQLKLTPARYISILFPLFALSLISRGQAQEASGCSGKNANTVACLTQSVVGAGLGERGQFITNGPDLTSPNAVLVTPLTASLPLPSPASGFTFSFDHAAGGYIASSSSFGPILAERAETIGRRKLFIGFTFQRFSFSSVDGRDPHNLPGIPIKLATGETVTDNFNVGLSLNQFTVFGTYGLTDRIDLSVAIPFSSVHFSEAWTGVVSLGSNSNSPPILLFNSGSRNVSGLGDVTFRAKGTLKRWEHAGLALGVDVRTPTGNEYDALGAGAVGLRPFVALSASKWRLAPHVNVGYEWNGESILAGEINFNQKRHIPSQFSYAFGADYGVLKRLTLDFDILGLEVIHGDHYLKPRSTYNMTNGAAGFKVNPFGKILIVANLLFKMNDAGLRAKIVPLVGISYTY